MNDTVLIKCAGRPGIDYLLLNCCTMTSFRALEKAIVSKEQLAAFKSSKAYSRITAYVDTLNDAVVGLKLSDGGEESQVRRRPPSRSLWRCFCLGFFFLLTDRSGIGRELRR